jgi:hypothetical protein
MSSARVIILPDRLTCAEFHHRLAPRIRRRHAGATVFRRLQIDMFFHLLPQRLIVFPPRDKVRRTRKKPPQHPYGKSSAFTSKNRDVAYDRSLDGPSKTTGTGLAAASCKPFGLPNGTTTDNDQGIDFDDTKLNGGAPGAEPTEGGIASIDPGKLSRDPSVGVPPRPPSL